MFTLNANIQPDDIREDKPQLQFCECYFVDNFTRNCASNCINTPIFHRWLMQNGATHFGHICTLYSSKHWRFSQKLMPQTKTTLIACCLCVGLTAEIRINGISLPLIMAWSYMILWFLCCYKAVTLQYVLLIYCIRRIIRRLLFFYLPLFLPVTACSFHCYLPPIQFCGSV